MSTPTLCPSCGFEVTPDAAFCENCGGALTPTATQDAPAEVQLETPIDLTRSVRAEPGDTEDTIAITRPCTACGGVVGADGYCETCGTKALSERDHYTEQPASWVAGCCDKGIRHHRNEDAPAIAADAAPRSRAVLVVCDGVSTSLDSDVATLAGARAAREVLVAHQAVGMGTPASRTSALVAALTTATEQANAAVIENTAPDSDNAASCTFAAAVIDGRPGRLRQRRRQPGLLAARRERHGRPGRAEPGRLGGPGPDRHGGLPRGGRERSAGPRHHQVAGPGQPGLQPAYRCRSPSPGPAGCWSAPTGCGTTSPRPAALQALVGRAERRRHRPAAAGRGTGALGQRARAARTTSPLALARHVASIRLDPSCERHVDHG